MTKLEKILICANLIVYTCFLVFSYAYVDLNLTLSKNTQILSAINTLQRLGYYNRPLAATIYIIFLLLAFGLFIANINFARQKKISIKYIWINVILIVLISAISYPFLSSDIFNYMFDAKIILKYHASPYTHRGLDFPQDEWLRFMRWTHRYSPYGPVWLGLSLIPAFFGFSKFVLSFITFKIFIGSFHLFNTYIIFKTLKKFQPQKLAIGTAFYALNPLFLIEGVINGHNDIILATSLLLSVYFLFAEKKISSQVALVFGFLIKYISIINLPILLYKYFENNISPKKIIYVNCIVLAIFTFIFSTFKISVPFVSSGATQVQFQPWYLFWTLPYVSLLPEASFILLAIVFSFGAELRYVPFMFNGDWIHPGTIMFMQLVIILPAVISLFYFIVEKNSKKQRNAI